MRYNPSPSTTRSALPIAVTMGEPAGIGGEIACLAWAQQAENIPPIFLIDDPDRIVNLSKIINHKIKVKTINKAEQALEIWPDTIPILPISLNTSVTPGKVNASNASCVMSSLDIAIKLVENGEAAALVTNPIQKSALHLAGFKEPGHTEYLAKATNAKNKPVMMLSGPELRVVPVTIHMPLLEAARSLNTDDIIHCSVVTALALKQYFNIPDPRLIVAGLNPHAGENGVFGDQELNIITPAINNIREKGIKVFGPCPADTIFHAEAREKYDAAICMYHAQALIPLKMLDFYKSVNITLGLSIIRTSPDHGTALDIAGKGIADPRSFIEAVHVASAMALSVNIFNQF